MKTSDLSSYAIANWVFLRALFLIFAVAFCSLAVQARGLWGIHGILPISTSVSMMRGLVPSLFWFSSSDAAIVGFAWLGAACAVLGLFGILQGPALLACFALYLSYSTVGQDFLSFQWDSLLLEVAFAALFVVSWRSIFDPWAAHEPPLAARLLLSVVLFKLMFLSGVVKLTSGDVSWRNLTALNFHYWTQPLPNPLAPFLHALPAWLHKASTLATFAVELALPFLIFWPRARLVAAVGFAALSGLILLSGNFAFFNWLTLALTVWLVPDSVWSRVLAHLPLRVEVAPSSVLAHSLWFVALSPLFLISFFWCVRWALPSSWTSRALPLIRWSYEWRLSSPYGLFASMTKSRPEITIEGSHDGESWQAYEFAYKPGRLSRAPPVVAPHQPRLDWQMWFAALGRYQQSPWLAQFQMRLLEGSPDVLQLLARDPFAGQPPRFVRARISLYEFAPPAEILSRGVWWHETPLGAFGPVLSLRDLR